MCGLFAMFAPDGGVSPETLEKGIAALSHRGPDDRKVWVSPDRKVGLAHARLSIIDLVTGEQPLRSEDGKTWAIVNGELYGYEEIQRQLTARGHTLRTKSDSEILLHLYEERGVHCLESLRGEFAFVLWDEANRLLFAGRDRFGIKPLFYSWYRGTLYLASEAKALFAAGVPARWDVESLFQTTQMYLDPDRSLFEGVAQVPPGHHLLVSPTYSRIHRYWDLDYPTVEDRKPSRPEEHVERITHAIDEAVRLRLRADVPVGCYLSGGIDSCAVLGMAARHSSTPIDAFTVAFQEAVDFNEERGAEEMAKKVGARFHPLRVSDDDLAAHFSDAVFHSEGLPGNENGVAKYLLSGLVRAKGCKVVLTGEGGDEVFGGYAHFRRDLLLARPDDPAAAAELSQLEQKNPISKGTLFPSGVTLPMEGVRSTLGFVPSWLEAFSAIGAKARTFFDGQALRGFEGRDPFRAYLNRLDVDGQLTGRERIDRASYLWTRTYLHNYVLTWLGDRAEMAHSVEGRLPLLDHKLFEASRALPPEAKIKGGVEKWVLREAARPFVTPAVASRQKHPFTAPPASQRLEGRLHQLTQDVLRSSALESVPLVDPKAVRRFLDALPKMSPGERHDWSFPLMRILGACVLQQRFSLS